MEGVTATDGKEKVMFEHKTEEEARKEILSMVEGDVSCEKRRL